MRMRCLSGGVFSACGVLVLGLTAVTQTWAQAPYYSQRDDPYYRGRGGYDGDPYSQQRSGYGRNQGNLIGRVMSDLNRAAERARLDRHEVRHFDEVASSLREFDERWARGRFDTGKLDKAIHNLEHLADADRVHGRDRDLLARDLQDLREFRASRGRYY